MASSVSGGDDSGMAALLRHGAATGEGSARLLERFAGSRDEAAFAALVARHGPMVRATCRRLLANPADADDAFQATFLVLARRAGSVGDGDRLAPWLHGVARRVAARCRRGNARRRRREVSNRAPIEASVPAGDPAGDEVELRSILDEELARLPGKYRDPLILCYFDGLTSDEAARRLAWPVGTVRTRLAGGRDRLRMRLARRGYAPDALLLLFPAAAPPTAAVSPTLLAATVRLALGTLAAGAPGAPAAVLLARGVLASMLTTKLIAATLGVAATATLAVGTAGLIAAQGPAPGPGGADRPVARPGPPSADGPGRQTPKAPAPLADELEATLARLKSLEAELVTLRRANGSRPVLKEESIIPDNPPLVVGGGPDPAPVHPPGPTVTTAQAQAAYFNAWSVPLGDGWRLDSPRERDQVIVFRPGSGRPDFFPAPGPNGTVVPVISGDRVGLHLVGPRIGEVAAYSPADHRWSRQALRDGPVGGRVMPTMLGDVIEYTVGRFIYAYSPKANRWGVLELAVAPAGIVPDGSILGPPGMTIPEGNVLHVFDAATGEWTHRTKDGQAVAAPTAPAPEPATPATALDPAPAPPREVRGRATSPDRPRQVSLQQLDSGLLMSISPDRDRFVMLDPKTERRATLRFPQPMGRVTPVRNSPGDEVLGFDLYGPAITRVALFDPKEFRWYQHDLADPVTSVRPLRSSPGDGGPSQWVTFELAGPRVVEAVAFNIKTREWHVDKLDQPPQPSSTSVILADSLKITRSGAFYHFRRLPDGPAIHFEAGGDAAAMGLKVTMPGVISTKDLGLTSYNGTFCVRDGDILNVVDRKAMTLRRIDLAEDGDDK